MDPAGYKFALKALRFELLGPFATYKVEYSFVSLAHTGISKVVC